VSTRDRSVTGRAPQAIDVDADGTPVEPWLPSRTPGDVMSANAQVALGVLDALVAAGYRTPEDVAVASIDDPLPRSTFWPRLTMVEQPGYDMGKTAVELLLERLTGDGRAAPSRKVVFDAKLLVGSTSGGVDHPVPGLTGDGVGVTDGRMGGKKRPTASSR